MSNPVVVIPIYKQDLTEMEMNSLKQCFRILGSYSVVFVCAKSQDITFYQNILTEQNYSAFFKRFPDKYFRDVNCYSKLLLNKAFYEQFTEYEYMLIYQLDAWVFEDKLEYWCSQNYDYIGAPWFEGYDIANENSSMLPVAGNGGFSLRKIASILKILNTDFKAPKSLKYIYDHSSKKTKLSKILNIPIYLCRFIFQKELYFPLWQITNMYEDVVFARYGQMAYCKFKLAPPEIALKFSFETQPMRLYEMNNNQLPFGCHAFEKYDFNFWKQFINL